MKICNKCNLEKQFTEFYFNNKITAYSGSCKECVKKATKANQDRLRSTPEGLAKDRARHRDKYYRLGYKEKHKPSFEKKKEAMERYKEKYPEKVLAKNAAGYLKPTIKGNELHHWSYNTEHLKDVIELTLKEHSKIHRYVTYDQERMMYRISATGVLLDTREAHEDFIKEIEHLP